MLRKQKYHRKEFLFIFYGVINVLFTNILLQFLLLLIPTIYAALLSQIFNFLFGLYFYGKKVFKVFSLTNKHLLKYFLLNILVWNLNWIFIEEISAFGISKNLVSLIIILPLAFLSYIIQKYFVFRN